MADVADRAELLELLSQRAREGSVWAMKTLLEELRRGVREAGSAGWDDIYGDDNVTPLRRAS